MLSTLPLPVQAGFWGLFSGSALVLGALIGFFAKVPQRIVAAVMAFGSGVLISALSFELVDEAYTRGGFAATAIGFLGGALVYTVANWVLAKMG
ncbi:ZIP family zinc transporter, partial [bacterium]